jgi:hypothetical protein
MKQLKHLFTMNLSIKKFLQAGLLISAAYGSLASAHDHGRNWDRDWTPQPYQREYQREVVRSHNYTYYPAQQVYFSQSNNNWFWANGGAWQMGARLPAYLNVDLRFGGVPVALRSDRPYVQHDYVESSYGRPWRESHEYRRYEENRRDYDRHHGRHNERQYEYAGRHGYEREYRRYDER